MNASQTKMTFATDTLQVHTSLHRGQVLFGLLIAVALFLLLSQLCKGANIACPASPGQDAKCSYEEWSLWGTVETVASNAVVAWEHGDSCVLFHTELNRAFQPYASCGLVHEVAQDISTWKRGRASVRALLGPPLFLWIFLGIFGVTALVLFLAVPVFDARLDRVARTLHLVSRRPIGSRHRTVALPPRVQVVLLHNVYYDGVQLRDERDQTNLAVIRVARQSSDELLGHLRRML